jgi:hypothetical protein
MKIALTLMLALWAFMIPVSAEIPSDLQSVANTWEFLAAMGRRCETHLEWQGYAGVNEEVCLDFQKQFARVSAEFSTKAAAFEEAARAVDATQSLAERTEFNFFMQRLQASTEQAFKAMQHILFLKQNEIDKRKPVVV